ncbi:hypothetical protein ANN_28004 [Periplaneta americana]|uniref:Mutator-like transposase domain-containing protein n=1 Tax=Periplaneta americana TaxID=6978 RepID=A0ABQ8RUP5_PERAM|nr:hypothetical protein ANN_28004 [Periplaneta americana]
MHIMSDLLMLCVQLGSKVEVVTIQSMKQAVQKAVEENSGNRDLTAPFDATWHKRWHTPLHGVVTATSVYTGKVLDMAILSKHCRCVRESKGEHEGNCTANYSGTSGDENPQHHLCPKGTESWCKYNMGLETGEKYIHHHCLPLPIMEVIKPVFRDLAAPELLKKCLHGQTQNPNECVNSVIWSRIPKTVFVGLETLHFGAYDAIATFNDVNIARCEVFNNMGMEIGLNMVRLMIALDKERLRAAERAVKSMEILARQEGRSTKRKLEEEFADNEDSPSYGTGMY